MRKPDLSFVRKGRLPDNKPPRGYIRIAPDLLVEVVSPRDVAEQLELKITEFLGAGVPLVWVVYPETRSVHVYHPEGLGARMTEPGVLSGEDIFPDFSCPVADIFDGI